MAQQLYCLTQTSKTSLSAMFAGQGVIDTTFQYLLSEMHPKITAICKEVQELPNQQTDWLAYSDTLRMLHERHTLIPMRYGSLFKNLDELQAWLSQHAVTIQKLLQSLEGYTEIGVRILLPEVIVDSTLSHTGGAAYLQARRKVYSNTDAQKALLDTHTASICGALKAWVREQHIEQKGRLLSLAFLVPMSKVNNCRECLANLPLPQAQRLFTGPWPPYHFVNTLTE